MTGEPPARGACVVDARTGRVGEVMDHEGRYVQLRPLLGGREWDCPPEDVRPASPQERLSAKLTELNHRSRTGT
ncbi:hypothetical protein JJV70_17305 [Streptomyces sp. JJ66]|uniref:hypothetical protein n=1 Tax=Streptomyces sp. JJ66 TaxID=2803843 RepID=UPI001C598366|nr:hypothetical protein [Streptomyces sp. JJ66]MBW1603833.1 hypothetical protein [Streptomyces sp. JJ66]